MQPVMWCPDLWCQAIARRTSQRASLMLPCTPGAWRSIQGTDQGTGPRVGDHACPGPATPCGCRSGGARRRTCGGAAGRALVDGRDAGRGEAPLHVPAQPALAPVEAAAVARAALHARVLQVQAHAAGARLPVPRGAVSPRPQAGAARRGRPAPARRPPLRQAGPPLAATLQWQRAPGQMRDVLLRHERPVRGQHRLLQPRRAPTHTSEARRRRRFAQLRPGARAARRAERAGAHTWCASSCRCGGGAARRRSGAARCAASPAAAASSRKR